MSLFTSETVHNHPLYDGRPMSENSEGEPLPSDTSTEGSTASEENITVSLNQKKNERSNNKVVLAAGNGELSSVKSFDECKECNGKTVNDALSQENIQLLKNIRSKEKKLKDTRRQLNEERAFYEQQKLDLCKTITKKKSRSQVIQTDASVFETNTVVKELETEITGLKKELEKEKKKASKLKERCQILKTRNGQLKSEISLNEEDYEKSWKEIRDKLETYKKDYGTAEKNSGIIKNIYDQVLTKNAHLARSNFALQAELRRLYRKFDCLDKSLSTKKLTSKSSVTSALSSPDLWRRQKEDKRLVKRKKKWRSKTVPSRTFAEESSENLVVSGSLISVHVAGDEKRLRPVFLVLDDKKKRRSRQAFFGGKQDPNLSVSSPAIRHDEANPDIKQRENDTIIEIEDISKEIRKEETTEKFSSIITTMENDESEKIKKELTLQKIKTDKKKRKVRDSAGQKQKDASEQQSDLTPEYGSPHKINFTSQPKNYINFQEVVKARNEQLNEKNHAGIKNEQDIDLPVYQENDQVETNKAKKIGNIAEDRRSDSENVIIECRTHSSSVQ